MKKQVYLNNKTESDRRYVNHLVGNGALGVQSNKESLVSFLKSNEIKGWPEVYFDRGECFFVEM